MAAGFGKVGRYATGSQRIVGAIDLMRRGRKLEQTPGLIDPDVADDVGRMDPGVGIRTRSVGADCRWNAQIIDGGAVPHGRIVETDSAGHAVAELGSVLNVVDAGVGIIAAEQGRIDVARKTVPRRRIGRGRLAESEAGELDEKVLDRDVAAAGRVEQLRVIAQIGRQVVRVKSAPAEGGELKVALTEGADDAVFGRSARIDRQRQTRTGHVVVGITILLAEVPVPGRRTVGTAIESDVGAQITTQLDAGVGTRNIEETGTIQRTDLHILNRFGLDWKIGRLRAADGQKSRRRAENEFFSHFHYGSPDRDSCVCMLWMLTNGKTLTENDKAVNALHLRVQCDVCATPALDSSSFALVTA